MSSPLLILSHINHNDFRCQAFDGERISNSRANATATDNGNFVHRCPAGDKFIYINNFGNVSPCPWVLESDKTCITTKSLRDNSLEEIKSDLKIENDEHMAGALMVGYPNEEYCNVPKRNQINIDYID